MPLTHWVEGVFAAAREQASTALLLRGHAETAHAVVDHPTNDGAAGAAAEAQGHRTLQHLPWFLAGLFGLAALLEGAFLVRRTRFRADG